MLQAGMVYCLSFLPGLAWLGLVFLLAVICCSRKRVRCSTGQAGWLVQVFVV